MQSSTNSPVQSEFYSLNSVENSESVSGSNMQRPAITWRSAYDDDGSHRIDIPPAPPTPKGRGSRQAGWKLEKCNAVLKKKLFWIPFAALIFALCLIAIFWLWHSNSDDLLEDVKEFFDEIPILGWDRHAELSMVNFAAAPERSRRKNMRLTMAEPVVVDTDSSMIGTDKI
uniref:Uncharacterized protein n=1 Tax=Kalanchoe fedtschenkoi TaxID=63787 RepID=A0A7N0TCC1_KALFE